LPLGGSIRFNLDQSYPAPGFHLGFTDSYTLSYTYNPAGQLASITNPFSKTTTGTVTEIVNETVIYNYNKTGQLLTVDGTNFSSGSGNSGTLVPVPHFASNFKFRAWGALKHMEYANDLTVNGDTYIPFEAEYNRRLQLSHLYGDTNRSGRTEVQYYDDGQVNTIFSFAKDSNGQYQPSQYQQSQVSGLIFPNSLKTIGP